MVAGRSGGKILGLEAAGVDYLACMTSHREIAQNKHRLRFKTARTSGTLYPVLALYFDVILMLRATLVPAASLGLSKAAAGRGMAGRTETETIVAVRRDARSLRETAGATASVAECEWDELRVAIGLNRMLSFEEQYKVFMMRSGEKDKVVGNLKYRFKAESLR